MDSNFAAIGRLMIADEAATVVEYAILLALIALIGLGVLALISPDLAGMFGATARALGSNSGGVIVDGVIPNR